MREETLLTSSTTGDGVNIGRSTTGEITTLPTLDTTQGGGDGIIAVEYEYDASGQMIAMTDDNGNTTEWTHDVHGQKLSETKGDGPGDPGLDNTPTSRQVPTDHVSYVENTIQVTGKPTVNHSTKIPIQVCRDLPARQMPTDHASYVEDTLWVSGKPTLNRLTTSPPLSKNSPQAMAPHRTSRESPTDPQNNKLVHPRLSPTPPPLELANQHPPSSRKACRGLPTCRPADPPEATKNNFSPSLHLIGQNMTPMR